ncbi:MAG: class I SAM-dependent methyltransferase [Polyangiales bacterium]
MSLIVKSAKLAIRITVPAIPLLGLVTALSSGCNERSSSAEPAAGASAATHEHSSGAEDGFPHPHHYADRLDDPKRRAWQKPREVVELLACEAGMVAADVGAGTGYFLADLSKAVGTEGRVLALDTEPTMVDRMTSRIEREGLKNARASTVLPDDPGLARESVDRVLVVNTWHHISDRVLYAEKLRGALRSGGQLMIVDFTMESPHGPPAEMRLTIDTIVAELEAAGFAARVLDESLPYQYVVLGIVP